MELCVATQKCYKKKAAALGEQKSNYKIKISKLVSKL